MATPKNIDQVYTANPITTNASTDLMYFGQSPFGINDDAAMTYANFAAQFGGPYTAAALTKTNDTNVTLTLGGTPTTALLEATSLTLGWTGTLSGARGGTGVNNSGLTINLGSPTSGYVLTSDSSGNATWQAAAAGGIANGGLQSAGQFLISSSTTAAISHSFNAWDSSGFNLYLAGGSPTGSPSNMIVMGDGASGGGSGTVVIGDSCSANGDNTTVIGSGASAGNNANAAIAIGYNAVANFSGSFVSCDSNGSPKSDTNVNQFCLTFAGGYNFYANNGGTVLGQFLPTGSSIIGTNTNNNATAGYVGEFVSSVVTAASPVTFTSSTTPQNLTTISLTAGDWDLTGNIGFSQGSVGFSLVVAYMSTTTAGALPDASLYNSIFVGAASGMTSVGIAAPSLRLTLSTTTTIYLIGRADYSAGTTTFFGGIYARRRR